MPSASLGISSSFISSLVRTIIALIAVLKRMASMSSVTLRIV